MNSAVKIQKFALPALFLITPFLVFLKYNSYCLACAETSIVIGALLILSIICSILMLVSGTRISALVMAVLIVVFLDLQFAPSQLAAWADEWIALLLFAGMQTFVLCLFLKDKFLTIATAVFSTFFVVSVIQLVLASDDTGFLFTDQQKSTAQAPPRIVHLILDEHIGIDGIPADIEAGNTIKHFINQFYLKNGFQVFGGAFSRYFYTHLSMGNMLNFSAESNSAMLINGRGPYKLLRNTYFSLLSDRKYRIDVLSPGWIDYCSNFKRAINRCIEKHWGDLKHLSKLALPISQKLQVMYSRYINQSTVVSGLLSHGVLAFQSMFPAVHDSIHQWTWGFSLERTRTDSLGTLMDLQLLWKDILLLPPGRVLFAHLSIPHYPYVALSDCSIRPPSQYFLWNYRGLFNQPPMNTVASRKERYQQYFEQLKCLYLKLDELFDGMRSAGIYNDSIIILHGDHGSRIVINDPTQENRHALTRQDLVDGFSTLFAMKIPGQPAGYDKSPWPLEELFAKFAFEAGLTPTRIQLKKSQPYVYLSGAPDTTLVPIPYDPPK